MSFTSSDVLIIAGEKSGEEHALSFLPELKKLMPKTHFYGVGGDLLSKEKVELLYHLNDFSSMGFSEVLLKLPFYFRAMSRILSEVKKRKTKTAILIDFQGFNLKLASKLKSLGVNVLYYVAPQAWAWKEKRAYKLQKFVHTLFTILPFEKEWFEKRGVKRVKGVPHPLVAIYQEELNQVRSKDFKEMESRKKRILLLPGSRNFEVGSLLPVFSDALELIAEQMSDFEIAIVKSSSVLEANFSSINKFRPKIYSPDELSLALNWADVAIAASGTVTLTTALFHVPTVVCYKLNLINEFIATNFISYKGPVSLTNIIHHFYIFPEFLMYRADRYNISKWVLSFLKDENLYQETVTKLKETKSLLSGDNFSVAEYMAKVIDEK